MLLLALSASAQVTKELASQAFFNLTADEVRIDSVLPSFCYSFPLQGNYGDSVYSVSIDYPEFIDVSPTDIARLKKLLGPTPTFPAMPDIEQGIGVSRRQASLLVSFVPLVCRDGKLQKLVSFKLTLNGSPCTQISNLKSQPSTLNSQISTLESHSSTYADHSVLASGTWAKISIPETGIFQLTDALARQCGFSSLSKVKIYGYGGALQPERLNSEYLQRTDDLQEVPTCMIGGRRLFHGTGPVSYESASATSRTRNPYSSYGYYFLTESDGDPITIDSTEFVSTYYPTATDYHTLYEVDNFAWYHSGRNLYDNELIGSDQARSYQLAGNEGEGRLTVILTSDDQCEVSVTMNDSLLGTISNSGTVSRYTYAIQRQQTYNVGHLMQGSNHIELRCTSGTANVHLDYLLLTTTTPKPLPDLRTASLPVPQYVYRITNQDHHADGPADMVIIIPTTQRYVAQAERLKTLHETMDSLRVRIVPADELFNEFGSGTPDANAYRRYLKMLYDRAESEADMPRYLLLFGDGSWDNRMLSANWLQYSPDDFLLCYESENSFSATESYVCDDFFCMLDEGEGTSLSRQDMTDVGVGRLPARSVQEAEVMVDKIVSYRMNEYGGDWQNVVCFMGDDGNDGEGNIHMLEADTVANYVVARNYPDFNIKKIYWDAYQRIESSTGGSFPDVERLIHQQMNAGALIMDYCGHGAAYSISHEKVLLRDDFATPTSLRLPLWVTASCDIMPFDSHEDNIGETAMLNKKGGAIAFFGTTRTVYTGANMNMNGSFIKHVLGTTNGRRNTLGDAVRLSKNELRRNNKAELLDTRNGDTKPDNKLHYSLLGDPALTLAMPTGQLIIDSINGQNTTDQTVALGAGELVTVSGHVADGADFDGVMAITVKGEETTIRCHNTYAFFSGAEEPFLFRDRPSTFYNGRDSVKNGRFNISFKLPRDITYSTATGLMTLYALNNSQTLSANGSTTNFTMGSGADTANDGIGPSVYCWLNSSAFVNGGNVNTTPYFFAELSDNDGINVSGSAVGHNLELCIDGEMTMTYDLNEYFEFNFGDYRSGTVGYSLPELTEGQHTLTFRAWDVLNNSSISELKFNVVRGLTPQCFDVTCTRNPATTSTTFIVSHDRAGSTMDVTLEIFDMSGRQLWRHSETGVPTDNTYSIDWNLTVDSGSRLHTGVYLYRVLVSTDGATKASAAKKLIIL